MRNQTSDTRIVLGSRSPRRLELLRLIVPAARIDVVPPRSAEELDFHDCRDLSAIDARLLEIARRKCDDVLAQLGDRPSADAGGEWLVVTADTVIVADDVEGRPVVLGQPPREDWEATVRQWFVEYLLGRTHLAATGVCVAKQDGRRTERVVHSRVSFHDDRERLEWYIGTGEPQGKAGGYALQGAGSVFVAAVEGSVSNVIGLPLREVLELIGSLAGTQEVA
ncbi:MAG: Maf family protein [Planctomycetes bacterium]|nr:Maf family protein [Planctomycetota bacterium]